MHTPSWLSTKLDIGHILTIGGMIVAVTLGWAKLDANQQALLSWQNNQDKAYAERRAVTDARFTALEAKIAPLEAVQFRLGKQEADTVAANARIDRIVDSFSEQLKELRKDVNAVGTKVEVLTRSLEDRNQLSRPMNGPR